MMEDVRTPTPKLLTIRRVVGSEKDFWSSPCFSTALVSESCQETCSRVVRQKVVPNINLNNEATRKHVLLVRVIPTLKHLYSLGGCVHSHTSAKTAQVWNTQTHLTIVGVG